jgi:hypothetical protein
MDDIILFDTKLLKYMTVFVRGTEPGAKDKNRVDDFHFCTVHVALITSLMFQLIHTIYTL